MCVHNWKHAAAYRIAHELIGSGRLGEVICIALDRLRTAPAGLSSGSATSGGWRLAASSGGGILIDHGWHVFYLMRWLLGGVDPVSVSALMTGDSSGIEDVAEIRVAFPNGRIATSHLSWRAPMRRTRAMIYGAEGALEMNGDRIILTARSGDVHDVPAPPEEDDSYHSAWFAGMAAEFEQAVRDGAGSVVAVENLAEARVTIALLMAARESGRLNGALVKLS
jgi:predicted dehydrogenase